MPDILEIRILPPLAIGRLGSSSTPLENYTLEITNPVDHRSQTTTIIPSPSEDPTDIIRATPRDRFGRSPAII